jgi:large-conductance mechanosensitive channel
MTIELNEYGLMIDLGNFLYISLGWAFIILTALVLVGVKVYNKIKTSKKVTPLVIDDNDDWMTK